MRYLREEAKMLVGLPVGAAIVLFFASFRLSGDALSVLVGTVLGVVISIPASLLILSITRRERAHTHGHQRPVVTSPRTDRPVVTIIPSQRTRQALLSSTTSGDGDGQIGGERVQIARIRVGRD